MKVIFRFLKKIWLIILLVILILPVVLPLFKPGMFVSDDGEWMIIRFSAFHQAFRDGQFPVRWLGRLNHEYGYPVANFLYPGFMYLAEIPKVLGFGFVDSIKIILLISIAGSAIFSYLWLKKLFGELPAFFGAIFYLYAPYHLWDIYKRGSVGEVLALATTPFILWAIEKRQKVLISFGIAFLILSHNILALLFLPIILGYLIFRKEKFVSLYYYSDTIIFGLGMAAFFWIPAIYDLQYTRFFQTQVADWYNYFPTLSILGLGTAIVLITSPFFCLNDSNQLSKEAKIFLIVGLFSSFLALRQSSFLWQILPANFIQFPFRFLSLTILSAAFLTAFLVNKMKGRLKIAILTILGIAISLSAIPYLKPTGFFDKGEGFYATNEDTTTVKNEYMPKWVKLPPTNHPLKVAEIISGNGKLSLILVNSRIIKLNSETSDTALIRTNRLYFPGWQAKIDGKDSFLSYNNPQGVMEISIPSGKHQAEIFWQETPMRKISDIISLTSLFGLIVFYCVNCARSRKKRAKFSLKNRKNTGENV